MMCEAERNCTSMKNNTMLIIKLNTSSVQYFLRYQWLLSLSRYSPEFYGIYGSLQSSREYYSMLS
jgi:hypothetical protein